MFCQFFKFFFIDEDISEVPDFSPRSFQCLNNIIITEKIVYDKLSLNCAKASGPDALSPWVLKACKDSLYYHIAGKFGGEKVWRISLL